MARFGLWKPLSANWASQQRMTQVDIISIHTMVFSLPNCDAMFRSNGYGGVFSHFGVGGAGECWQWQDTAYRAAANLNGNWHIISVECADRGVPFPDWNVNDGSAVPAFTAPQIETLAQLIATMCKAHSIPCELIPDAKPGRRGIGYHRQGVPGYMVAGAEQWSSARGKVCPGNRRIAQIPQIITRAREILAGQTNPTPAPAPEDDMPYTPAEIHDIVWFGAPGARLLPNEFTGQSEWAFTAVGSLAARISRDVVGPAMARLEGRIAGLEEAVSQVAKSTPGASIDLAAVKAAAHAGAEEALAQGVDVDVTVGGQAVS